MLFKFNNHISHSFNNTTDASFYALHFADMLHDLHQQGSILFLLPFVGVFCACEDILRVGFKSDCGPVVKVLQIFKSCLELMAQEVSIDLHVSVDLDIKGLFEVPQINFNPGFLNWSLNFTYFNLEFFKFCDLVIKQLQIWNNFTASLK